MTNRTLALAAIALFGLSAAALAQDPRSEGWSFGGAQYQARCASCHGANFSKPIDGSYPKIAGQHADYIEHSLKAYRSGQRKNAVMAGMAAALTDADIRELARYYSKQRPALCSTNEIRKHGKCKGL